MQQIIEKYRNLDLRFMILVVTVSVAGFSQGLLLPLLSVLLEKQGVSSGYNGLSSAALYIGILFSSPFMEAPVRKFGFKKVIVAGMGLVILAMILFPVWKNYYFWIILRLIVGVGDTALHFATQVWITTTTPANKRGRRISLYGLAYGIGFGIGPLGLILLKVNDWLPFIVATILFIIVLLLILTLKNEKPEVIKNIHKEKRYLKVYALAGIALMPMFIYGFLEATLNASFPIYGLRIGLSETMLSMLLSSFVIGSIIFQLPLGILSDYIGRRKVLIIVTTIGSLMFSIIPYVQTNYQLFIIFVIAGAMVGSLYSLGLAYVADLIPPNILSTANVIASIHFGVGSMLGPYLGGLTITYISPRSLFYLIAIAIALFPLYALISLLFKGPKSLESRKTTEV